MNVCYAFFRICACLLFGEDEILFSEHGFSLFEVALAIREDILALQQRRASHVSEDSHLVGSHLGEGSSEDGSHSTNYDRRSDLS